jgi:hypothetical protein
MESKNGTLQPRIASDVLTPNQVAELSNRHSQVRRRHYSSKENRYRVAMHEKNLDAYLDSPNNSRAIGDAS